MNLGKVDLMGKEHSQSGLIYVPIPQCLLTKMSRPSRNTRLQRVFPLEPCTSGLEIKKKKSSTY